MQDTLIAGASELRLGISLKDPSLVGHIANDSTYLNRLGRNWMCDNYYPYKHLRMRAGGPLSNHLYKYLVLSLGLRASENLSNTADHISSEVIEKYIQAEQTKWKRDSSTD